MKNFKGNKGVTLISLTVYIILVLIVLSLVRNINYIF
jgi:small-conductance mechanosensitive channel